jgi:hypothetical protein
MKYDHEHNAKVVERVRMCIAEAGYDPKLVRQIVDQKWLLEEGFVFLIDERVIPIEVGWRAKEISGVGEPKCFRCADDDRIAGYIVRECAAVRRLEHDCGARSRKV